MNCYTQFRNLSIPLRVKVTKVLYTYPLLLTPVSLSLSEKPTGDAGPGGRDVRDSTGRHVEWQVQHLLPATVQGLIPIPTCPVSIPFHFTSSSPF